MIAIAIKDAQAQFQQLLACTRVFRRITRGNKPALHKVPLAIRAGPPDQ